MSNVTEADVREIISLDSDISTDAVNFWIDVAEDIYDDLDQSELDVDEDRLVRLMSAHFCTTQDPRIESGSKGGANVSYMGEGGMDWESSRHGQVAKMLAPEIAERSTGDVTFFTVG